jgi:hypothetical protein
MTSDENEKLVRALDDLLVVYDHLERGERAEGDRLRLEAILGPILTSMDGKDRESLFGSFVDHARESGWDDEGILDYLDWLANELGLELNPL